MIGDLIEAKTLPNSKELNKFGVQIGKLYTDFGLPIDMALDRIPDYTKSEKLAILDGCCEWLIEHRRMSGAPETAIERQRKTNKQMVERYLTKGETGAY